MKQKTFFEKAPKNCDHPREEIELVRSVNAAMTTNQCQLCGYNFHIIGQHDHVDIHGDYLNEATYRCVDCQITRSDPRKLARVGCNGGGE